MTPRIFTLSVELADVLNDSYDVEAIPAPERDVDEIYQRPTDTPEAVEDDDLEVVAPMQVVNEERERIRQTNAVLIPLDENLVEYQAARAHEFAANQEFMPVIVWSDDASTALPWMLADAEFVSPDLDSCIKYIQDLVAQQEPAEILTESVDNSDPEVGIDHPTVEPSGGNDE